MTQSSKEAIFPVTLRPNFAQGNDSILLSEEKFPAEFQHMKSPTQYLDDTTAPSVNWRFRVPTGETVLAT